MRLDELDKNSKYGYCRRRWDSFGRDNVYIAFDGSEWRYVALSGAAADVGLHNKGADDWYLTDIPNRFYKRVAIVTDWYDNIFTKGDRIIQCDGWTSDYNNRWMHADYRDERVTYRTLGSDCEWEDEMEVQVEWESWDYRHRIVWLNSVTQTAPSSCSDEPIPTEQKQKENKMDLKLLMAMMAAMSVEEAPKDATNSDYVVIVTKAGEYEGYFYANELTDIQAIVAEPKNELKKFHVFNYSTTLGQKPRKVIEIERG